MSCNTVEEDQRAKRIDLMRAVSVGRLLRSLDATRPGPFSRGYVKQDQRPKTPRGAVKVKGHTFKPRKKRLSR